MNNERDEDQADEEEIEELPVHRLSKYNKFTMEGSRALLTSLYSTHQNELGTTQYFPRLYAYQSHKKIKASIESLNSREPTHLGNPLQAVFQDVCKRHKRH